MQITNTKINQTFIVVEGAIEVRNIMHSGVLARSWHNQQQINNGAIIRTGLTTGGLAFELILKKFVFFVKEGSKKLWRMLNFINQ